MSRAVIFRSGSIHLASVEHVPTTIAVDLGFAKSSKSCGIAWRSSSEVGEGAFTFGGCVEKVAKLLAEVPEADLIIEAPLCGFFSSAGNPVERGDLERRAATATERAQYRYWYSGPGAATCLAAIFFLRELRASLEADPSIGNPLTVTLYEGFLTFKTARISHEDDARSLRDSFLLGGNNLLELAAPQGVTSITVLDILSGATQGSAPPALVVPRGGPASSGLTLPAEQEG